MTRVDLTEGWTDDLDFILKADGTVVPLSGWTITLILKKADGTEVDTTGNVSIVDPGTAKVRYTPDAADLTNASSPYKARFKAVDPGGQISFFPSGEPDRWTVWAR